MNEEGEEEEEETGGLLTPRPCASEENLFLDCRCAGLHNRLTKLRLIVVVHNRKTFEFRREDIFLRAEGSDIARVLPFLSSVGKLIIASSLKTPFRRR